MPRTAIRKIIRKRKQIRKKLKKGTSQNNNNNIQQTEKQQMKTLKAASQPGVIRPLNPLMLGFNHQQYGNPDLAIQQMRNQNQMTIDQISSYRTTIDTMKKQQAKYEDELKKMKKQAKTEEHDLEKAKLDREIAKDNLDANRIKLEKAQHYNELATRLQKEIIESETQEELNKQMQELIELEAEKNEKEIQMKLQEGNIKKNKMAALLEQRRKEVELATTENQAQFEYMQSKSFVNPEKELVSVIKRAMDENEMKACIAARDKLIQEQASLYELLNNNPNDYNSIQEQIMNENKARNQYIAQLQIGVDNLHDKDEEIKHLRQTSIELKNKVNDLNIETAGLNEKINSSNTQELIHDAKETSKQLTKLEVRNDQLKHQIKLNDDIRKEEENNKILKAKKEAYENMGDDPIIQQQTKELVEKETKLEEIQKETEELELINKEDRQLK